MLDETKPELLICANDGCDNAFVPKTHNMKYCNDECCRIATNRKIMEKYYAKRAQKLGYARYCECGQKLSRYNSSTICNACELSKSIEKTQSIAQMLASVTWIA